jgi:hypothetical protein
VIIDIMLAMVVVVVFLGVEMGLKMSLISGGEYAVLVSNNWPPTVDSATVSLSVVQWREIHPTALHLL